jgi:hypothetical protein
MVNLLLADWHDRKYNDRGEEEGEEQITGQTMLLGSSITIAKSALQIQNDPNPFNPSTTFSYHVPDGNADHVSIDIYSLHGQHIAVLINRFQEPGDHQVHGTVWAIAVKGFCQESTSTGYRSLKRYWSEM